ncbi:ubiquitin-conjugating enzyme E2 32-like isoform X1 [Vigna unguiculata]|uniref:Ubiquitin-conjugating enzyme E2 J1 n=1 Tax=Vigna unguiculata TaxID=3917 RepID=A0A4D6KHZ6_VIGUN|nr:ubiquitin-conjugating enzyme E2 32-like isoform X1 [Vigna unguiculata]QCD77486.1 ubiquitin-conjugating enzyme E2 J1 [Vigna unguiculata]
MADKYNLKNPAVKRILQEVKEMHSNPSDDFMSLPLEENIFEWQFAIRGPRDTEFEGGIYHGRIQLPSEYPFKPPSFMLLTPNGRFETQTKICLSISNHHPEHWQPSWSVRTALVALIAFMPTNPNGALGSLDYKKDERRTLAVKSREAPPKFGTPERQKLIDEIHEYMLSKAPPVPQPSATEASEEHPRNEEAEALVDSPNPESLPAGERIPDEEGDGIVEEQEVLANANPAGVEVSREIQSNVSRNEVPQRSDTSARVHNPRPETRVQKPDDRLFTVAAIGLAIAIVVLLLKKFIKSTEHGALFSNNGS